MSFTIQELHTCADRELRYRERVYSRLVANGRMTHQNAERQIALMRAIRDYFAERLTPDQEKML